MILVIMNNKLLSRGLHLGFMPVVNSRMYHFLVGLNIDTVMRICQTQRITIAVIHNPNSIAMLSDITLNNEEVSNVFNSDTTEMLMNRYASSPSRMYADMVMASNTHFRTLATQLVSLSFRENLYQGRMAKCTSKRISTTNITPRWLTSELPEESPIV